VAIRFLLSELDNIELKIRKRVQVIDSDSVGTRELGIDRQMLDYHALQIKVIWSLLRLTRNEILSIFENHADSHIRSDHREPARDAHRPDCVFVGKEVEVLAELSRRWNLWCREYESEGFASHP
jgi:hypothetical protein